MPRTRSIPGLLASALFTCFTASAVAQSPPPNYGFDWVTIGAPGNRPTNSSEVPLDPSLSTGAVGYEYRMMRSKLDVESYLEFVTAYAPHWSGTPTDWELTGPFIVPIQQPGGSWTYQVRPGYEGCAARIEWQMAARYCNWLQNDKRPEQPAFESGVYDTSTFNFTPGAWSAQLLPSPGARYWIPSRDEWIKAAHYDPNRYGSGQEGYWLNPAGSDAPLVMGYPEQGGQTIGDLPWQINGSIALGGWPLGQYPAVQSPWGLIDISATVPDYTSFVTNYPGRSLTMGGSLAGTAYYFAFDRLDLHTTGSVWGDTQGALRMASIVPAPAGCVCIGLGVVWGGRRRCRYAKQTAMDRGTLPVRHIGGARGGDRHAHWGPS